MIDTAITPYAGTSGYSGSDASRERAETNDSNGRTASVQSRVFAYVTGCREFGATIAEIRDAIPSEHHGTLSGALSVLHKEGILARLTEKRNRCSVYVLPGYVGTREQATPRQPKPQPTALPQVTVTAADRAFVVGRDVLIAAEQYRATGAGSVKMIVEVEYSW